MHSFESLRQAAVDAIRLGAFAAYKTIDKKSLFGFAICTDNELGSVFHVYATREWVSEREAEYPEIGFISVEWEQGFDDDPFLALSSVFRKFADSAYHLPDREYENNRIVRFRVLVEAMRVCRDEGLFDANTLLSVDSTDPDDLMTKLACEAARHLNIPAIAEAYLQTMEC